MFNQTSNPFVGLVKVILVLMALGLFLGLALAGTDLTNFITNSAKAEGIRQDNQTSAAKDRMELAADQKILDAKVATQGKLDEQTLKFNEEQHQLQMQQGEQNLRFGEDQHNLQMKQGEQDLQSQAQKAAQERANSELICMLLAGGGAFFIACLGIGIMVRIARPKNSVVYVQAGEVPQIDRWNDPAWRNARIHSARRMESAKRNGGLQVIDIPKADRPMMVSTTFGLEERSPSYKR